MIKFVPVPEEEEKAYQKDKAVKQRLYGECWDCRHFTINVCAKTGMPLRGRITDCCGKESKYGEE